MNFKIITEIKGTLELNDFCFVFIFMHIRLFIQHWQIFWEILTPEISSSSIISTKKNGHYVDKLLVLRIQFIWFYLNITRYIMYLLTHWNQHIVCSMVMMLSDIDLACFWWRTCPPLSNTSSSLYVVEPWVKDKTDVQLQSFIQTICIFKIIFFFQIYTCMALQLILIMHEKWKLLYTHDN